MQSLLRWNEYLQASQSMNLQFGGIYSGQEVPGLFGTQLPVQAAQVNICPLLQAILLL